MLKIAVKLSTVNRSGGVWILGVVGIYFPYLFVINNSSFI